MRLLPSCLMVKVHVEAVRVDPRSVHVTYTGTGTYLSPSTSVLISDSINSYSFSPTCFCYEKDERGKPGNLPKKADVVRNSGSIG